MRRVMKPISERVTSEYWAQANANDCARSKNNSTRLTDVDEQDAGQQERNYIFFLNLPENYSFILNITELGAQSKPRPLQRKARYLIKMQQHYEGKGGKGMFAQNNMNALKQM